MYFLLRGARVHHIIATSRVDEIVAVARVHHIIATVRVDAIVAVARGMEPGRIGSFRAARPES